MPRDPDWRQVIRDIYAQMIKREGMTLLGWRDVPTDNSTLGESVKPTEPVHQQVFIGRGKKIKTEDEFERRLYILRKSISNAIYTRKERRLSGYYPVSISCRTIVYKGMFLADQLGTYYPDLHDKDFESALALVHQRFSTNTFPTWSLAHPYRMIAHNGEINTLRGNNNWMAARQASVSSDLFGDDINKLWPISYEGQSDTACFDNALEFLVQGGYPLAHAMMMMIPEAWAGNPLMDEERRAFYEYNAALMEPWDGPAAIAFTNGRQIGATLDRNGLRPARYFVTRDERIIMASEMGVLPIPEKDIVTKWRLQPGKMLLVDLDEGRLIPDEELKATLAKSHPYKEWLERTQIVLEDLPDAAGKAALSNLSLLDRQQAFGYTQEDLRILMSPMGSQGEEAVGSMGNDTPISALSDKPKLLFTYFKQNFAQVTNPPIDPIREELVMSLVSIIGPRPNLFDLEGSSRLKRLEVRQPILTNADLEKIRAISEVGDGHFKSRILDTTWPAEHGAAGLKEALDTLCVRAEAAVREGINIIILSDRRAGAGEHSDAVAARLRGGASSPHPPGPAHLGRARGRIRRTARGASLRLPGRLRRGGDQSLSRLRDAAGDEGRAAAEARRVRDRQALHQVDRQGPAQGDVQDGHLHLPVLLRRADFRRGRPQVRFRRRVFHRHRDPHRRRRRSTRSPRRPCGGTATPSATRRSIATRSTSAANISSACAARTMCGPPPRCRRSSTPCAATCPTSTGPTPRSATSSPSGCSPSAACSGSKSADEDGRKPVPIEEVEPAKDIVRRFATGAMSFGSISREAHTTLAIAMNRIGGKSNTGEGGEEADRFKPLPNGDSMRSAIKQVASGRFGVTTEYLVNSDMMQIKMAQGAKPGEGGQLPGHKVDKVIAKVRHSMPGVGLISPPPHHDIYSIEDLAQLIFDLKNVNPEGLVSVKLVSEVGVGTVAAGVSKARADHVTIAGFEGGTGASPLTSIKHAGSPWEIGLAETHQTLVANRLRGRIAVQVDGGIRTGRDVVVGALLGADEFGFSTAPLIAAGCIMMRKCHLNTCPVGVATQDPVLRKRFVGQPEHVINFFFFVAEEVRELMAAMGFRTFAEMVGQMQMLDKRQVIEHWKAKGLDFSRLFFKPHAPQGVHIHNCEVAGSQDPHHPRPPADRARRSPRSSAARRCGSRPRSRTPTAPPARCCPARSPSVTAMKGCPHDTIHVKLTGTAGQSFGAWLARGVTFELEGDANDYVGKGLSGGRIIVRPTADAGIVPEESIIVGNTVLYGAIEGECYFRGVAGERFAVRNSGAIAVIEGAGDHCCEYMTGGIVVVLGRTGRNFAAGMSGGIAYVLDEDGTFKSRCNMAMVELEPMPDEEEVSERIYHHVHDLESHGRVEVLEDMTRYDAERLHLLITRHARLTGSARAAEILAGWKKYCPMFRKVMPLEYRRALAEMEKARTMQAAE